MGCGRASEIAQVDYDPHDEHSENPKTRQAAHGDGERLDLFDRSGAYPAAPGWRQSATGETSREAAEAIRAKAPRMLDRVRELLAEGPASPEQLHAKLARAGVPTLLTSVRARVCQLRAMGEVCDSGARGKGESNRAKVIVWRLTTPDERSHAAAMRAMEAEKGPEHE